MALQLHNDTNLLIESVIGAETQSILLVGERGSGSLSAALMVGGSSIIATLQPTDIKGHIDEIKGSVRIVQIRDMAERITTAGSTLETVIIDRADTMGAPAQNAFLKLLEEPRTNLRFILTAHNPILLLPTILSRVQRIPIKPITRTQSEKLIKDLGVLDSRKIQQILFLASGLPAEITRLSRDAEYFSKQISYAGDARTYLQGAIADKVIVANRYHGNRAEALAFLLTTQRVLTHGLYASPSRNIIVSLDVLANTYKNIAAGGNVRLHLLSCVI